MNFSVKDIVLRLCSISGLMLVLLFYSVNLAKALNYFGYKHYLSAFNLFQLYEYSLCVGFIFAIISVLASRKVNNSVVISYLKRGTNTVNIITLSLVALAFIVIVVDQYL